MPIGIFLYEIEKSFGPQVIADYYVTQEKITPEILKDFNEKHIKKDLVDATIQKGNSKYYSSLIQAGDLKKNLYLGFIIRDDEDLLTLKSGFEKVEEKIVENFTDDKKQMKVLLKTIFNSILDLMEKLKEPLIIKETINEKTKKLLDEGKNQEAIELIELGNKIPEKLSQEVKFAEQCRDDGLYKKAKKYYLRAAEFAEQIHEAEFVEFLLKIGESVGEFPEFLKNLEDFNNAIKKGLEDLENREVNIYDEVIPLIDKNLKLANFLEDNELTKTLEELNKLCQNASRRANELIKLDNNIKNLIENI